jgi:DNA polymerase-4
MRTAHRVGRTVVLRVRFGDFGRATRSYSLPVATAETHVVLATARSLIAQMSSEIDRRGLTLVGVAVTGIEADDGVQLSLPLDPRDGGGLDCAVDEVCARFGVNALTRAVLLGRDNGDVVPLLRD